VDRRHFLAGTGLIAGLAGSGAGRMPLAALQQQEGGDGFEAFLESLGSALGDTGASVVDGAAALGYGVVLLTTGSEAPGDEAFDRELEVVAEAYRSRVEAIEDPLAVGLLVEVYQSPEGVESRGDAFATYAVTTTGARTATASGDVGTYLSQVRGTVSPPVWAASDGEGSPAVELREHELVTVQSDAPGVGETPAVEATIANAGNGRSGTVELVVDWYDADEAVLATTRERLQMLRSGETWIARAYPETVAERSAIADSQATLVFDDPEYATPEGLAVAESDLSVGGEARVFGALENGTGGSLLYVEAIGRVLDSEGRVLGDGWTNDTDVEAGATWRFDVQYRDEHAARLDAVDRYEVIPLGTA